MEEIKDTCCAEWQADKYWKGNGKTKGMENDTMNQVYLF